MASKNAKPLHSSVGVQSLLRGNATAVRELRQHQGMAFPSFNLFPHPSMGKNAKLAPQPCQRKGQRNRRRIESAPTVRASGPG